MKKLVKTTLAILIVISLVLAIASCSKDDDNNGGGAREAKTYTGTAEGVTYTLKIEDGGSRAVLTPKQGDKFTLTQTRDTRKSTGTVTKVVGGVLTLAPKEDPDDEFTATVSGDNITAMSGTITWDDGTANTAPVTLTTPSTGGTGDGGDVDSDWKWTAVADGTIWSYAVGTYTIKSNINAIAYGSAGNAGGRFVAVGQYYKKAYSDDGESWTAEENSIIGLISINAVAYGNGKFVAVCDEGQMTYSDDGISWTAVTAANRTIWEYERTVGGSTRTATADISGIAYGNNRFVAVGWQGKMAYSTDGINWTAVSDSKFPSRNSDDSNSFQISAIAYGNNRFVAGGSDGKMAYSSDGASWTAVANSTFGTSDIDAIAYGNNRFVAVGGSQIAYSDNGTSWTAVSNSTFSGYSSGIYAIAYGNNRFVAGGSSGKIAYSSDGTSWTAVLPGTDIQTILGIAYGNGRFVAVGGNGKMAYADW